MEDSDISLENKKMEFQIYITEYNQLRSEIQKRLDFIDRIVYYYIIILLGVLAASKLIEKIDDYLILIATLCLDIIGIYYAANLYLINMLNKYLTDVLKVKLTLLVSLKTKVLDWEKYILEQRGGTKWGLNAGLLFTYYWVVMLPLCILLFLFSYKATIRFHLHTKHSIEPMKVGLSILNIIILFITYIFCSISKNVYESRKKQP